MVYSPTYSELTDPKGPYLYVWRSRLDDTYEVVVIRGEEPYMGELLIYKKGEDGEIGDELLFQRQVNLSYNAQFGPDFQDVEDWSNLAIEYADNPTIAISDLLPETPPATDAAQVKHLGDASVSKTEE